MNSLRAPHARYVRYRARHQARLDAETSAKLEEFAAAFHWKRSAVLRCVMRWGLTQTQGWIIDQSVPTTVQLVPLLVEPALLQQVQGRGGSSWCAGRGLGTPCDAGSHD
jgi:hypothetical protein